MTGGVPTPEDRTTLRPLNEIRADLDLLHNGLAFDIDEIRLLRDVPALLAEIERLRRGNQRLHTAWLAATSDKGELLQQVAQLRAALTLSQQEDQ